MRQVKISDTGDLRQTWVLRYTVVSKLRLLSVVFCDAWTLK